MGEPAWGPCSWNLGWGAGWARRERDSPGWGRHAGGLGSLGWTHMGGPGKVMGGCPKKKYRGRGRGSGAELRGRGPGRGRGGERIRTLRVGVPRKGGRVLGGPCGPGSTFSPAPPPSPAVKPWKPRWTPSEDCRTPGPARGPDTGPAPAPARAPAPLPPGAAGGRRGAHAGESAPSGTRAPAGRTDTARSWGARFAVPALEEVPGPYPSTLSRSERKQRRRLLSPRPS